MFAADFDQDEEDCHDFDSSSIKFIQVQEEQKQEVLVRNHVPDPSLFHYEQSSLVEEE